MPRPVALGLALALTLRAAVALAATCPPVSGADDLCAPGVNPCLIQGKECPVVGGTTLDFGTRAVVLQNSRLDVGTGTMIIAAGSLELRPGSGLLGHGGAVVITTIGNIAVLREGSTKARIDVADPAAADRIELTSTNGTIQIDGFVDARGTNSDGAGGTIDLTAQSIVVAGDVLTAGGHLGVGGPVSFDATGSVVLSGLVDASGGSGGSVDIEADGTVNTTGTIELRGTLAGGDGGLMTILTTTGSVILGGKIFMQGDEGTDLDGGGSGGELNVFAAANFTLTAALEISGSPPDGQGGDVFFTSGLDIVQTGLIQAQGRGSESDGGSVEFDSHRDLTVGPIDVHGGENLADSGGGVEGTAWCNLTVPGGVTITAEGDRGEIVLSSGALLTAAGTLKTGSRVLLEYLTSPSQVVIAGGTFVPPVPEVMQNPALIPCGGIAPESCGDGNLDAPDEECDDGNDTSCDGCSAACHVEACGNGRTDCGEECDDGNTDGGDGCSADCQTAEFCGDGIVQDGLGETCDDENLDACDGCSSTCQLEECGNGVLDCGEECDDGNTADGDGCSQDCLLIPIGCGDGPPPSGDEECDDGNITDGDGCSHQCREERCGNGIVDPGEDCDDFDTVGCDGCSPTCAFELCGNGVQDCGEECDEGAANGTPGSSCLAESCRLGQFCTAGVGDECIPCATRANCDPLDACGSAACAAGVCIPVAPVQCNDGNACNGAETCDTELGCQPGSPLQCDDGDTCNGTETCDPAAGCRGGTPREQSDGDECTVDTCDAVLGPLHTELPDLDLAVCRLAGVRAVVSGAAGAEIAAATRTKVLKKLGGIETKLSVAKGGGKRGAKALTAATKRLKGVVRYVGKQQGKKIGVGTAGALLDALGAFEGALSRLRV